MRATSPLLVTPVKGNLVAQNRSITAAAAAQAAGETKPVNPNEGTVRIMVHCCVSAKYLLDA
jgi:hypothetical protein